MPAIKLQGLKGLPGLNRLSDIERQKFYKDNENILNSRRFKRQKDLDKAAEIIYNNQQFVKRFGKDAFNKLNDNTEDSYNLRNTILKNTVAEDAWAQYVKPFSPYNDKGLAKDNRTPHWSIDEWTKYNSMSPDARIKLMESDWLSPVEANKAWKVVDEVDKQAASITYTPSGAGATMAAQTFALQTLMRLGILNSQNKDDGILKNVIKGVASTDTEASKQFFKERNDKILENIYNDDIKDRTNALGNEVSKTYLSDPSIANLSDDQVKKTFYNNFVSGNSDMVKLGKGEFASHWGSSEMKDFSIDDMRQALAKKKVYMQNMSPDAATTALNNEAKEYIKDHQGSLKRAGLFLKDVGISALSYTADKINGVTEPIRWAEDRISGKPSVWLDTNGNIIDSKRVYKPNKKNGSYYYGDNQGNAHDVRQVQIDRSTLHQMGKNYDGSEDNGILNPQYWSRAEQFGTLDSDEQKKYEKLGSSPYKVAYDPNEDSDLWYEAFKMSSFSIADAASQLIPFGIGMAGKALSTASKVGNVTRKLGQAIDYVGKGLTAQTKAGQVIQGSAGAAGIAYAYERGAFQETLAQNMANAEETLDNKARKILQDRYSNNKAVKDYIDEQINNRTATIRQQYLQRAKAPSDRGNRMLFMNEINKQARAQATTEIMNERLTDVINHLKKGTEWAKLQQEAITSAGDAAFATYLPEAIKYGAVNNFGFRKFLYTNPAGVTRRVSSTLKGLREITNKEGRQRLATGASKFLTRKDKWKQFGKTLGSQAWGGAWTNGTDDMMTDAAERINNDSFERYTNGFYNDQAVADTYGFTDGLYSYLKGFRNSLGQETTMGATTVGALGSLVSFSPNFVNIAHYTTKEGREAFRNQYARRYKRDDDGFIQRNEDGSPKIEKISAKENWRERANFFISNGVLNSYYAKKQSERDLQNHADYINNILDDYNDFEDIEKLVMSSKGLEEAENEGDKKTMKFLNALHAVNALENLAQDSKDPAAMSSVVEKAKSLIDDLSEMDFDVNKDNIPEDEDVSSLIAQYYARNKDVAQNLYNDRVALSTMIKNAKELKEATEAYNKAEKEVQKAEKNHGQPFATSVREKLKLNQALNGHWKNRLETMKGEINDPSTEGEVSDENLLPSLGGKKNAEALVRTYNRQEKELNEILEEQQSKVDAAKEKYDEAKEDLDNNTDDSKTYGLQKKLSDARAEYDEAVLQRGYNQEQLATTRAKRDRVSSALEEANKEGTTEKKVLTADEIFNLDPVTRARMMNKENRDMYSKEQQSEIEKLEHRLVMQDSDALQKIQDISTLTQRIEANSDTYNRIMQNPEAAAVRFEAQRSLASITAYNLINQRNAQSVADVIDQMDEGLSSHKDVTQEKKDEVVYRALRRFHPELLSIIEEEGLLPKYQKQVADAKEWAHIVDDLNSVITNSEKDDTWKQNIRKNIDYIVEAASNKDEIISNIEKAIDDVDNPQVKQDLDAVLQGMVNLGYQRDSTILENRKKRKEREEANKSKSEEERKRKEDAAKASAAEAATKEAERKNAETEHPVNADGSNILPTVEGPIHDANDPNAEMIGEPEEVQSSWAAALMEKGAEAGSVEAGEMWSSTGNKAKKGTFTATLKDLGTTGKVITFSIDGKAETIAITPDEWFINENEHTNDPKERLEGFGITKDTPFRASSLYHINGNWYFEGGFLGHKEKFSLRVSDKFDLDNAIDRERKTREVEHIAQGEDTGNPNLTITDDTVQGKTESIEDQSKEIQGKGNEQHLTEGTTGDLKGENTLGETKINGNETTLSGNAMAEYVPEKLINDGVLERKKGAEPNDSRNRFYRWMDNAGIHLQDIVDDELARILQQNPHVKVKFMAIKGDYNATDDNALQNHLMLVIDYDDKINKGITSIHDNDKNGGVIKSDGKQYLIIGVAGYGNSLAKRDLYDILYSNNPKGPNGYGIIRKGKGKFFAEHPEERFYVDQTLETEIVPNSLIPGYIVKQLKSDSSSEYRSIIELLSDEKRNPHGYTLESLSWGIQELSKYLIIGRPNASVMLPRNPVKNAGNAFVLMPASNGKMVPSYLKPLFYNEMRDGELKSKVMTLLNNVVSPNYSTRLQAVIELSNIFYFNPENGDTILLRKSRDEISLVHGGEVFRTFVLDSTFDRQAFLDAMSDMNPRVNITANVLSNSDLIKQWAEAGALDTDAAKFGTAGSSYSIYAIDADGNMMKRETPSNDNNNNKTATTSYRNNNRRQVVFQRKYYTFADGKYYLNGIPVTDASIIEQLDYNKRVIDGNYKATTSKDVWDYYIMPAGENPDVVRINRNSKEVVKLSKEEATKLIDKLAKEEEERRRKEAAEEALNNPTNLEDVDLGDDSRNNREHSRYNTELANKVRELGIATPEEIPYITADGSEPIPYVTQLLVMKKVQQLFEKNPHPTNQELHDAIFIEHKVHTNSNTWTPLYKLLDAYNDGKVTKDDVLEYVGELFYLPTGQLDKKAAWRKVVGDRSASNEGKGTDTNTKTSAPIKPVTKPTKATQTFAELHKQPKYKVKLSRLIRNKWKDAPKNIKELADFLRKKNIEVDAIGTSQEDIEAWMKTIEDCR